MLGTEISQGEPVPKRQRSQEEWLSLMWILFVLLTNTYMLAVSLTFRLPKWSEGLVHILADGESM